MTCKHLNVIEGHECSLGLFGGYPDARQCAQCDKFEQGDEQEVKKDDLEHNASAGFGDTVAKITSAAGIKPCGKCKKRQQKLNRIFPYKQGESSGCKSCGKRAVNDGEG